MPPEDPRIPFLATPWTRNLLSAPKLTTRIPGSRVQKPTGEDALYATTLNTPSTLAACIAAWHTPAPSDLKINEVSTFCFLGDGMDGHPGILHGGIIAALIDEGMGILLSVNWERDQRPRLREVDGRLGDAVLPMGGLGTFTAYLNLKYLRPVRTGEAAVVVAWYVRREGRKEFLEAEVRQPGDGGEVVVCARGEALFVTPREKKL